MQGFRYNKVFNVRHFVAGLLKAGAHRVKSFIVIFAVFRLPYIGWSYLDSMGIRLVASGMSGGASSTGLLGCGKEMSGYAALTRSTEKLK